MREYNISQIPVVKDGHFVGSLNDTELFQQLIENPQLKLSSVEEVMSPPFKVVEANEKIEKIAPLFSKDTHAVLIHLDEDKYHIITKHDLIDAFG